jgi:hypothetical protein
VAMPGMPEIVKEIQALRSQTSEIRANMERVRNLLVGQQTFSFMSCNDDCPKDPLCFRMTLHSGVASMMGSTCGS